MTSLLLDLVDGGELDPVIDTGDAVSTRHDLRVASEQLAEWVARELHGSGLMVAATNNAAFLISAVLAAERLGCAIILTNPHEEPEPLGLLLTDQPVTGSRPITENGGFAWHGQNFPSPAYVEELPTAPSVLLHTSGSTGSPTAVVKTLSSIVEDSHRIAESLHGYVDGPVVCAVPPFHSYGFTHGLLASLIAGARVLVRPPTIRPRSLGRTIHEAGARTLIGLPMQYHLLADSTASGFAVLEQAVSAGAPLPVSATRQLLSRHAFRLRNVYGTSETGTITISHDVAAASDPSIIGYPLQGVHVRVAEETGELLVKNDGLAVGYAIGSRIAPLPLRDGWYCSGDLGEVCDEGLRIMGRLRDIINVAGQKTSRSRLEKVLNSHPQVIESQVSITADGARGDVPVARAVTRGTTVADLMAWCRQHLSPFEVPRRIELCEELPRSATGKLLNHDGKMMIEPTAGPVPKSTVAQADEQDPVAQ